MKTANPPPVADDANKVLADFYPQKKPKRNWFAIAIAMLASTTSILLGYDCSVMSGAALFIQKDWKISDVQIEVLVGIINICSLIGSPAAGRTSDLIGRRYTIVVSGAIFFGGALVMGLAVNYAMLMVGRVIAGIGVGYALMIAPVYTAEVAPSSSRGFLTSFPEVFINFGVLLGYVSNYFLARLPTNLSWRWMLGVGAIPSLVLGVGGLLMPESPRWLVMQGSLAQAKKVLLKTSDSPEEAELRLRDIKEAAGIPLERGDDDDVVQVQPTKSQGSGVWRELVVHPTPAVRRVLIAGVGIHFFQQACGFDSVVYYSPRIFQKAGITSDSNKLLATVAVGFVKMSLILVSTFTLDRFGRRPLLLSSVAGMVLSLLALASSLTVVDRARHGVGWAVAVSLVAVYALVGSFSTGLGPIAWVYSSEIFPLRLRAQGTSLGVAMNRVMSGVVGMTFLSLSDAITTGGAFFLFAGVAALAWLFFYTFLPETRGRTLEEMGELFEGFRWRQSWRSSNCSKGCHDENDGKEAGNGSDRVDGKLVQMGDTN